jgi:hypothetical protein
LTALQIALEGFAEDAIPALHRVQLCVSAPKQDPTHKLVQGVELFH